MKTYQCALRVCRSAKMIGKPFIDCFNAIQVSQAAMARLQDALVDLLVCISTLYEQHIIDPYLVVTAREGSRTNTTNTTRFLSPEHVAASAVYGTRVSHIHMPLTFTPLHLGLR